MQPFIARPGEATQAGRLDFDLEPDDAPDPFWSASDRNLPELPQKLTPSQAARLAEILDFLHRGLSSATENIDAPKKSAQVTLPFADWQKVQAVQMLLARYLRAVAEPDAWSNESHGSHRTDRTHRTTPSRSEMKFAHLHCHTHYSLLDGASRIPELVARAKALGMNALAITDHGNLYGAIEFYRECKAAGLNPIIGYEAYVAPAKRTDREARRRGDAGYPPDAAGQEPHRLQEPHQDGVGRLPGGLPLRPAHRQGTARPPTPRASSA